VAYQFIHIESYARTASSQRKKDGHASTVRSVCAEANREEDACPHVDSPLAPELLHGAPLVDVEARAMEWGEQARDAMGRKLRKDAPVLLAGVFSAPDSLEDWEGFKAKAVDHLRSKYGSRLLSVLEHKDEAHRHCHFYAVPLNGERFEILHEGKRASLEAKADGQVKGEQNRAYKAAMRGLQDRFFEEVSAPFGLLRLGPGRRRLTRAAYKAEQDQGAALAKTKVWAEEEKRAAVALADQAKAEADAALARRVEAEREAARVIADAAASSANAVELEKSAQKSASEAKAAKKAATADRVAAAAHLNKVRGFADTVSGFVVAVPSSLVGLAAATAWTPIAGVVRWAKSSKGQRDAMTEATARKQAEEQRDALAKALTEEQTATRREKSKTLAKERELNGAKEEINGLKSQLGKATDWIQRMRIAHEPGFKEALEKKAEQDRAARERAGLRQP
jgi:hypothetical protein